MSNEQESDYPDFTPELWKTGMENQDATNQELRDCYSGLYERSKRMEEELAFYRDEYDAMLRFMQTQAEINAQLDQEYRELRQELTKLLQRPPAVAPNEAERP